MTTIVELETELLDILKAMPTFKGRGYSIYNLDEVGDIASEGVGFPLSAVAYLGSMPVGKMSHNSSGKQSGQAKGIQDVEKQFAIVLAVEYNWTNGENTKPVATDLLDEVRGSLLGYIGVNTRPWRLIDEGPIDSNISGAILYMQTWATLSIDKGNLV